MASIARRFWTAHESAVQKIHDFSREGAYTLGGLGNAANFFATARSVIGRYQNDVNDAGNFKLLLSINNATINTAKIGALVISGACVNNAKEIITRASTQNHRKMMVAALVTSTLALCATSCVLIPKATANLYGTSVTAYAEIEEMLSSSNPPEDLALTVAEHAADIFSSIAFFGYSINLNQLVYDVAHTSLKKCEHLLRLKKRDLLSKPAPLVSRGIRAGQ